MDFHSIVFFCEKGEGPQITEIGDQGEYYPYLLLIGWPNDSGDIKIFFKAESDLVRFKNSAVEAYETLLRKRGKDA